MMVMRHIRLDNLEEIRSGELTGHRHRRVRRHLESCASCRARYQWILALSGELDRATRPPLPPGGEREVLARRAAGDRVILPVRDPVHRSPITTRHRWLAAAVSTFAAVVAVSWFATHGLADADQAGGVLLFGLDAPRPGDRVEVEYRPGSDLRGEQALILRGILSPTPRYERPAPTPRRLGRLLRTGSTYQGSFTFGKGDVYAELVVENEDGTVVDDHAGRKWHVLVSDGERPLRDALWAQSLLAVTDEWDRLYAAVRRSVQLYPNDARLRAFELSFELSVLTAAERDSVIEVQQPVLRSLATTATERGTLDPETLAGLIEYARTVGDSATAERFRNLLVRSYPRHPEAVWYRAPPLPVDRDRRSMDAYLAELESLWQEVGPHTALAGTGFWAARQVGRPEDILTWAKRAAGSTGWMQNPARFALLLAAVPAVRDTAIVRLRRELQRLDDGEVPRPLGQTIAEQRLANRQAARPLLVTLSGALVARGDTAAGLDSLRVAASIGWSPSIYRQLAALELASHDSVAAALSLARAAVVPFDSPGSEQSAEKEATLAAQGTDLVDAGQWERLKRAARDEMYPRVLAGSVDRRLAEKQVYVFDANGVRHDLDQLRRGTVTVVAFWEPRNGRARRDLPELRSVIHQVRAMGGELVIVTRSALSRLGMGGGRAPSLRLRQVLEELNAPVPLYYDLDRRATRAFEAVWPPEYHVLDYQGRLRFRDSPLEDIVAEVDALLHESALTASGQ